MGLVERRAQSFGSPLRGCPLFAASNVNIFTLERPPGDFDFHATD